MAYKGGARPKAQLTYDLNTYNPATLANKLENGSITEKELRKEYSRLRSIARKRLNRMGKSLEYADSQSYKKNKDKFVVTKDLKTEAQLRHKISELASFVQSDRGSIKGLNAIRDKAIKTFADNGYYKTDADGNILLDKDGKPVPLVNKKNFKEITKFLDRAREINKAFAKRSEQLLDFYDMLKNQGADSQALEQALKDYSRSRESMPSMIQNNSKRDSNQFRQAKE